MVDLGAGTVRGAAEEIRSGVTVVGFVSIMVLVALVAIVASSIVAIVIAGVLSAVLVNVGVGSGIGGLAFGVTMIVGTLGLTFLVMFWVYGRLPKTLRILRNEDVAGPVRPVVPAPGQGIWKTVGTAIGFVVGGATFYLLAILVGDGSFLLLAMPLVIAFVGAAYVERVSRGAFIQGGAEGFMGACAIGLLFGLLALAAGD